LARRFVDIFEPLLRSKQIDAVVAPERQLHSHDQPFYRQLLAEEPGYPGKGSTAGGCYL
jgi:L-lactate dehydrogenase complex protein LldE